MPIAFSSNLIALGDTLPWVAKQLEAMSDGDIRFEIFEPGKMIPAVEVFDAASSGKIDAGYAWMGYEQGKIAAAPLFGAVPFGMNPWEFSAWMYHGGGDALLKEVFAPPQRRADLLRPRQPGDGRLVPEGADLARRRQGA